MTVRWGGGRFIAVGNGEKDDPYILVSVDGRTWTKNTHAERAKAVIAAFNAAISAPRGKQKRLASDARRLYLAMRV